VGLNRQDALDAARNAGFETRVLGLPVIGDVLWRDDLQRMTRSPWNFVAAS
jgi:hypothetical protein